VIAANQNHRPGAYDRHVRDWRTTLTRHGLWLYHAWQEALED
jgi:hypothetical protein